MSAPDARETAGYDLEKNQEITLLVVLAIVALIVVGGVVWRKHRRHPAPTHHGAHAPHARAPRPIGTTPAVVGAIPAPTPLELTKAAEKLIFEVWVRDPEVFIRKAAVRPGPDGQLPPKLPPSVMTELLKAPLPEAARLDAEVLDEHRPLGVLVFDGSTDAGRREFVVAVGVKDPATAQTALAHAAKILDAKPEMSTALRKEVFKGSHSGLYLGISGTQLLLAANLASLERGALLLPVGAVKATRQVHDVEAHSPKGVLGEVANHFAFIDPSGKPVANVPDGLPKLMNDTVLPAVKTMLAEAGTLDVQFDVTGDTADGLATLLAPPGSSFSTALSALPTIEPDLLFAGPRDAIDVRVARVPTLWLEVARGAIKMAPVPALPPEISRELVDQSREATLEFLGAVDGEFLLAQVQDAPPTVNAGATMLRLRLRDEEAAKRAVHTLLSLQLPKEARLLALAVPGGAGECIEGPFDPRGLMKEFQDAPPESLPSQGFAYVIKHGYLYGVQGTSPRQRVLRFAGDAPEDHLGADSNVVTQVHRLPTHVVYAQVQAPLRADTPLPAIYRMKPLPQSVVTAIEPSGSGLFAHVHADLDVAAMLFGPDLAAIGITWMPSKISPLGAPPGMAPGLGGGMPGGGGGRRPVGPGEPRLPPVVPSSGFQLEVPRHRTSQ